MDDCSWVISFETQTEFKTHARALLDQVRDTLEDTGFQMDEAKTEVAWILAGPNPRKPSLEKAKMWKLKWAGIEQRFDIKARPVHWLGFFIDPRFNFQAHVRHLLALGQQRIKATARVMGANSIPRKLARKVAWAVAMSTAAYGVEAIW